MINIPLLMLIGGALAGVYFGFKRKDPNIELPSCFFDRLAIPLYTFLNTYYSNSGFMVDATEEKSILCNVPFKKLYGVKIIGYSTIHDYFPAPEMETLIEQYKKSENGYFYYILHKQGLQQCQYIFSFNESIVKNFANYFQEELLSGEEIANTILSFWCQNNFFQRNKKLEGNLKIDFDCIDKEPNFVSFKKMAREAIFKGLSELDVLQGFREVDVPKTNIQSVFKMNFSGVIWFFYDLYQKRIENQISLLINSAKLSGNKEYFIALKDFYSHNKTNLAIVNNLVFLKEYSEDIVGQLGLALKTSYIKKDIFRKDIIRKLPFKYRDIEFDYLVEPSYLHNFIASVHKRSAKSPDIFGKDKNGAFVNYSFSEENDNPHSCIVAKPGSGKSVSKQKIMSQMIDFDFMSGEARNLGKGQGQVRIRSYDVGFSDEKFINLLKSNPKNNVAHIASDLFSFKYNLVGIDMENDLEQIEADIQFAIDLTSVILESQHSQALSINEVAAFKKIIHDVYSNANYQKYDIRNLVESHPKIVQELLNLGYSKTTYLQEIQEKKYRFLKRPLLKDMAKAAKILSDNQQITEDDRKSYASLAQKLSDIHKLQLFSTWDNIDISDADVISMDLNNFKENSLFTPIYLSIFQKTYLKDREFALLCKRQSKTAPKLFYAIEEARNFFLVPYLQKMFETIALEARKYNVHLCFVVQKLEHIPSAILTNLDTRIFLLRPEKREEVIKEISKSAISANEKLFEAISCTESHELCIAYSEGVFHLKLPITDEELELFNTNPNQSQIYYNKEKESLNVVK
ncbi:hypothetical protein CCZ01_09170 [Helicobacter monodelphidis]|uniref:ATP-binding protein n=1 Tax=Helicobacter sp. 15-1451 TaxID=2004995 RepID=UPI000DCD476D|nr:ATP-binding protein [Helicobacter sp. 15-1451]RAX56534.1 hypothetical protein CCZ01_09170 [Helicobacter sp. 15-1451]